MSKKKDPDSLDRAILRCLIKDARMSLQEIGAEVGLSATPCWNRIKRMEEEGLIQGYTALVDPAGLGYADTVILQVTLESHTDEMLYAFGRALEAVPELAGLALAAAPAGGMAASPFSETLDPTDAAAAAWTSRRRTPGPTIARPGSTMSVSRLAPSASAAPCRKEAIGAASSSL